MPLPDRITVLEKNAVVFGIFLNEHTYAHTRKRGFPPSMPTPQMDDFGVN